MGNLAWSAMALAVSIDPVQRGVIQSGHFDLALVVNPVLGHQLVLSWPSLC